MVTRESPTSLWLPITPKTAQTVPNGAFPSGITEWSQGSFPSGSYTIWDLQDTHGPTFNGLAMGSPGQVAIDSTGRILIADTGNDRLVILTTAGVFDDEITGLTGITGVCADGSDNIHVIYNTDFLRLYDSALVLQATSEIGGTANLKHICTDNTHIYITDVGGRLVRKLTVIHNAVSTFGSAGSGNGQFGAGGPWGIVDSATELYVVDPGNNRVQVFDLTGAYVRQWAISANARGIALDASGDVLVAEYGSDLVKRYTNVGVLIDSFAQANPDGIVLATGDVAFVINADAGTLAEWDEDDFTRSAAFVWNNAVAVGEALGALALTVTDGDAGSSAQVLNSKYFATSRESVDVAARVRTSHASLTPRQQILFYDADDVLVSTATEDDWTPVADDRPHRSFAARVPANATQYRVGFLASVDAGPLTATAYLDDVTTGASLLIVEDAVGDPGDLTVTVEIKGAWL